MQEHRIKASPAQVKELQVARRAFDSVRSRASYDAEAAYKKNPELAGEAADGILGRAIPALKHETEMRINPDRCADRFVARWQALDEARVRQYREGDMSGYRATRAAMGDIARSLERAPQLESLLAIRKQELGIALESGRRLGLDLAFTYGLGLGRSRGIEI